jgi:hypothetical protein
MYGSVNWLVKYALKCVRNFCLTYKNFFVIDLQSCLNEVSVFQTELRINTSAYFILTNYLATCIAVLHFYNRERSCQWSCVWGDHLTAPKGDSDRQNRCVFVVLMSLRTLIVQTCCNTSVPYLGNISCGISELSARA